MTPSQISRPTFRIEKSSDSAAIKATYEHPLFHLKQGGYIEASPFVLTRNGKPSITQTYHLTAKGVRYLKAVWDDSGMTGTLRWDQDTRYLDGGHAPEHWMYTKDALLAAESSGMAVGMELTRWADYDMIRRVMKPKGLWRYSVEPDGIVGLAAGARKLLILFEIDRATETLDRWGAKTQGYIELLHTCARDPLFADFPPPVVCCLFDGETRRRNVAHVIAEFDGRAAFWTAPQAITLDASRFLTYPWMVVTERQTRTLAAKVAHDAASKAPSN